MAMVVQHNMQAMNASRMLGITSNQQAKSTEKLSSGFRINRAADDAAGLSISEKMRKQMRGLDRASMNAQDGVSAVQTAEGALTEVHDMLQRMNELAVQAANGTNSQSDREAIQNEVDQLVTEIDRVSETTKFNEMYLLNGDPDPGAQKIVTMNGHDAGLDAIRSMNRYNDMLALQNDSSVSFFAFQVDMSTLANGRKVNIGGKDYTIVQSVDDSVTEEPHAFKYHKSSFSDNGALKTDDSKITQGRALWLIGQALGQANYIGDDGKVPEDKYHSTVMGNDPQDTAHYGTVTAGNVKFAHASPYNPDVKWTDKNSPLEEFNGEDSCARFKRTENMGGFNSDLPLTFYIHKAQDHSVQQSLQFNLHVGADADMNNKIGVAIEQMNSRYLGIHGLDVVGKDTDGVTNIDDGGLTATYAIDAISDAVVKVSAQRSTLGAIQNRLEHTINNVDNVVENTTAAESRIRDTDMADEMVRYSKNNILAQAGQSMLAQANQATQGVLSLLGG